MKIKESFKKIKIHQRFVNLSERIKEPQTKKIIIFTIVGCCLLFYPLSDAKALEEVSEALELDKTPLLNGTGNKIKAGIMALTGLKVLNDLTHHQ
jgi:hypothetical protein